MKKLELKHLAPYLPYGISVIPEEWVVNDFWQNKKVILTGFQIDDDRAIFKHRDLMGDRNPLGIISFKIEECQPVLHPLSDLTEDQIEEFTRSTKNCIISQNEQLGKLVPSHWRQMDFIKLLEWNFDVFGLIEKGLAIDANTLNK